MQIEGRVPPYNQEAECAVLGSVLLDNRCWGEVFAIVDSGDFYVEVNRRIFDGMYRLFERGVPVDHVTLGNYLRDKGDLEKIGGAIALSGLTDSVAVTANVSHYANIIREKSAVRGVISGAQKVVAEGYSGNDTDTISGSMEELIRAAQELGRRKMPGSIFELGEKVLENYELVAGGYRGVELPWPSIDNMTAGLWPKTVTMFVARPNTGKSFICVICARHAWMKNKKVLIVSPEMSKEEMAERFFVVHSNVNYHDVVSGQLPTNVEARFKKVIKKSVDHENLWIMDSDDDLSTKGITAAIRACNPDLVAIDAIYDLRIRGDRRERILGALEWMKNSCKEIGYSVIGFAQQNRAAELSEKKGGGDRLGTIALVDEIAQDAHSVFALRQSKDEKADKILNVVPMKIRRGQYKKPSVRLHWDFSVMNFAEIQDDDDEYSEGEDIPF